MTFLYVFIGIVAVFMLVTFAIYQGIAAMLIANSEKPLSEDQKDVCRKTLSSGKKPSPYCNIYIKKGKCGSKTCDLIKD